MYIYICTYMISSIYTFVFISYVLLCCLLMCTYRLYCSYIIQYATISVISSIYCSYILAFYISSLLFVSSTVFSEARGALELLWYMRFHDYVIKTNNTILCTLYIIQCVGTCGLIIIVCMINSSIITLLV